MAAAAASSASGGAVTGGKCHCHEPRRDDAIDRSILQSDTHVPPLSYAHHAAPSAKRLRHAMAEDLASALAKQLCAMRRAGAKNDPAASAGGLTCARHITFDRSVAGEGIHGR